MKQTKKQLDIEKVRKLESIRLKKGYKQGWVFYRSRSLGILEAFNSLQRKGEVGERKTNYDKTLNSWSFDKTSEYINEPWRLDITWLEQYGIRFANHERIE